MNQQNKTLSEAEIKKDKFLGCLLGGAIGDALGAPVEFMSHGAIVSKYGPDGIKDYVEYPNGKGEFTDDTQMLLFTAEGLLRAWHRAVLKGMGGAEVQITHASYLRWLNTQGVGMPDKEQRIGFNEGWLIKRKELYKQRAPGRTCISALQSGREGSVENRLNDSKGCGTVMRIAPVGLVFFRDRAVAFQKGVELSALTHGHPAGYLSGGLLSSIIADLTLGIDLEKAISNGLKILKNWKNHEEVTRKIKQAVSIHNKFLNKEISHAEIEKIGQGWVAEEALAISILCALHYQKDFEKAVLTSVNHSGDSDSTGAITGNLVGLMLGASKIPEPWKENLLYRDIVEEIATDLNTGCKSTTYNEDEEWSLKYPGY